MSWEKIIKEQSDVQAVTRYLSGLELKKPYELSIKLYRRTRSDKQNRLMWHWLRIMSKDMFGEINPDRMHYEMKRRFLVNILVRDSIENDGLFHHLYAAVRAMQYQPNYEQMIDNFIRDHVSTTKLNTKLMAEYLTCIQSAASDHNIVLPLPEQRGLLNEAQGLCQDARLSVL